MSFFGTSYEGQRYREWLKEEKTREAAEEATRKAAEQARLRELTRPAEETMRKLRKAEQKLLTEFPDREAFISEDLMTRTMSFSEGETFNAAQARQFVAETPEYFECQENADALVRYFVNCNIQLISSDMYGAAFRKLRAAGLMIERPEPDHSTEPEQVINYGLPDDSEEQSKSIRPDRYSKRHLGWDRETGEEKLFSDFDIDQMSADDYRQVFRLRKVYRTRRPL